MNQPDAKAAVPMPKITVTLRPSTKDRSERLLAMFEVTISTKIGPIVLDGCEIHRTKAGHSMASLPVFCEEVDGKLVYIPTILLPAPLDQEIRRVAMVEYVEWQRARTPAPTERGKVYLTPAPTECAVASRV